MAHVLSRVPCDAFSKASRYDVTSYQNRLPSIRSELFANTPITVFGDEREALSVARDLAEMKTAQGDNYPFYVMDMGRLEDLLNAWREHMPRVQPFYSLRCNADPVLLRLLVEQPDVGFCCTNRVELNMAVELAGRERVLYANPLWTRGTVRHAREMGIELLLFESREDLLRMHAAYPEASLVLRVCMNAPVSEDSMRVGCELIEEAPELLSMAADLGVKVVGISFSIGARACSLGIYAYAIAQACRLFGVAASLGHDLCVLDIGGGFPCGSPTRGPSFSQEAHVNCKLHIPNTDRFCWCLEIGKLEANKICKNANKVAAAISASLDEYFPESSFGHVRIIAEPGRYFAASVFSLITNIIDKRAVDASVVTNDAFDSGTAGFVYQTNEGFFGSFGCRLTAFCEPKCRPLVECVHDVSADHYTYATILGPTLSNNVDIVQPVARLPQMQIGEWLLWDDMGAYSMGNRETLGEDGPPSPTIYYFVDDERWQHMSRPSTPERVADVDGSSHKCEGTEVEVDSHSMESMESESAVIDDEPYWLDLEQWLTD